LTYGTSLYMVYVYSMLVRVCKAHKRSEARPTLQMSSLLHRTETNGNGCQRKSSVDQRLSSEKNTLKHK